MWSDLDRSTWAEMAGSSRFLHMGLTQDIDAADEAIGCGCHLSKYAVRASVRSAWLRADVSRWRCEVRPNGSFHGRIRVMTPTPKKTLHFKTLCVTPACTIPVRPVLMGDLR